MEFYSINKKQSTAFLQSRFSETQKSITQAEPINYLELKSSFTEQVQLQYLVQYVFGGTVSVNALRGRALNRFRSSLLQEHDVKRGIRLHT